MSAYAILGATGNTGLNILTLLSQSPKNRIHVLVRSKSKLERLFPAASTTPNLHIFEGSVDNETAVAECLKGTKAAFLTVAVTENVPYTTVALDTAKAVVSALQTLRKQSTTYKPPRLVVLSAASMDDKFWTGIPPLVHSFLNKACSHIYADLGLAEAFLHEHDDWLDSVFVMPGGLSRDVQYGHELSATAQQTFLSFADLAAAMIEVADCGGEWDLGHVSVVSKKKAKFEVWQPYYLVKGLLYHYFPWLYAYLG